MWSQAVFASTLSYGFMDFIIVGRGWVTLGRGRDVDSTNVETKKKDRQLENCAYTCIFNYINFKWLSSPPHPTSLQNKFV